MQKIVVIAFLRISLGVSLLLSVSSCSNSQFASGGGGEKKTKPASGQSNPGSPGDNPDGSDVEHTGGTDAFKEVGATVKVTASPIGAIDVVIVLDGSDSMDEEKKKLQEKIGEFVSYFKKHKQLDYQITLVGESFELGATDSSEMHLVSQKIESGETLTFLQGFLLQPGNKSIRANASTHLVALTDANDKVSALAFQAWATQNEARIGKLHVNGFIGLSNSGQNDWCRIAGPGTSFLDLASMPQFGGLVQDLCQEDWSVMLDLLAQRILARTVTTVVNLLEPIDPSDRIIVMAANKSIDPGQITIDYPNRTIAIGGSIPIDSTTPIKVLKEVRK